FVQPLRAFLSSVPVAAGTTSATVVGCGGNPLDSSARKRCRTALLSSHSALFLSLRPGGCAPAPPERALHLSPHPALRQGPGARPVLLSPVPPSVPVLPHREELVPLPHPPGNEWRSVHQERRHNVPVVPGQRPPSSPDGPVSAPGMAHGPGRGPGP